MRTTRVALSSPSPATRIAYLTRRILTAAGTPSVRRRAGHKVRSPTIESVGRYEPDLLEALSLFEEGAKNSMPIRTTKIVSGIVQACCVPHAPWEKRETERAMGLFKHTLGGSGKHAFHCETSGCENVARFGCAVLGIPRACEVHRGADDCEVALNGLAVLALAESMVAVGKERPEGRHLEEGAKLHSHLAEACRLPTRVSFQHWGALNRLFVACATRHRMPAGAKALLPMVLSTGDEPLLNSYLNACGRAGLVDEAFAAYERGLDAGIPLTASAVSILVSIAGRARQLSRAMSIVERARNLGVPVDSDKMVVTSLLKACAMKARINTADEVYDRALAAGLQPDRALLNARALCFACAGQLEAALEALDMEASKVSRSERASARDEDTSVATLLHACIRANSPRRAIELFHTFVAGGYTPATSGPHAALLEATAAAATSREFQPPVGKADATTGAVKDLQMVYEAALAAGVRPDARLIHALATALLHVGAPHRACAAVERAVDEAALALDTNCIRALLQACIDIGPTAPLERVLAIGRAQGMSFQYLSDYLLRAHLASIPVTGEPPGTGTGDGDDPGDEERSAVIVTTAVHASRVDDAFTVYRQGQDNGWQHSPNSLRWLLRVCAEQERITEALSVLGDMQTMQIEPGFAALNALMVACRRRGDIDDATLQMWLSN